MAVDVVDVVAAVAVAAVAAASALFGRFRRIFNTCPRVQFPARFAPLLTCCKSRLNSAVISTIDILNASTCLFLCGQMSRYLNVN